MDRRSFLSAMTRLGAAVVASPLLALLPESQQDRIIRLIRERRKKHAEMLAEAWETALWGPPVHDLGIPYWVKKNPVQFRGNRYCVPIEQ